MNEAFLWVLTTAGRRRCFVIMILKNSVHVALGVAAVVVPPDVIRQILRIGSVEVPDGVVPALASILNYREQTLPVLELVESVFSPRGIALSLHVVIHAPLNVPLEQREAVARPRSTEPAILQLLVRVQRLQRGDDRHQQR
ncbi:hypothetical protein EYF80_061440 [Liparis tanakae]|uniref:Uncharacterized protein n=1 Tax=Liparis tanakae TaxID=230148 RepID=A0A4Z2EHW5_9TELE|nr:hypothetical protein EYF80_061440 [Liparis tanakae]